MILLLKGNSNTDLVYKLNRGVRLIGVGTVGGTHGITSFFKDLLPFCRTVHTV